MSGWLRDHRQQYADRLKAEWADEVGHDRAWWIEEAKRTRTDWPSLDSQRHRVTEWIRAGRPPLREFMKAMDEAKRK